jgi:Plasmid pRiA4b ORF-3-like protein
MVGMRAHSTPPVIAYQVKIGLVGGKRPVWRRCLVDPAITLDELHALCQVAMGWEDCHEYVFQYTPLDGRGRKRQFRPIRDDDKSTTVVGDVLQYPDDELLYVYDFGDHWEHRIALERILPASAETRYPVVIAGAGACPDEDQTWVGRGVTVERGSFDLETTNQALHRQVTRHARAR